jgi:hypothetical protein
VAITEWEKTYGEKAVDSMSVIGRLRAKEQILKEREADRGYRAKQKGKGQDD